MFKQLLSGLMEEKAGIYNAGTQTFRQIDPTKLSAQLQLEDVGKERGKSNIPDALAETPDNIEQKIASRIDNEKQEAEAVTRENLKVLTSRLSSLASQSNIASLAAIASNSEGDVRQHIQNTGMFLYLKKQSVTKTEAELAAFKQEHRRVTEATYPPSRFMTLAIIVLLGALEALMNGAFFAGADRMGLLGGMVFAGVLALFNVGLGIVLGDFGYRLVRHVRPFWKAIGTGICVASIALIVFLNLGIAHYRTQLVNEAERLQSAESDAVRLTSGTMAKNAFKEFMAGPADIEDMQAWVLVSLGLMAAFFVSYKKFRGDDPYFRYGETARRRDFAVEEYSEQVSSMLDHLKNIRDHRMAQLEGMKATISHSGGEAAAIKASFIQWKSIFEGHQNQLEQLGRILVSEYRSNNQMTRTTKAPKFFNDPFALKRDVIDAFDEVFEHETKLIDQHLQSVELAYSQAVERIAVATEKARAAYASIDTLHQTDFNPEEITQWLIGTDQNLGKTPLKIAA